MTSTTEPQTLFTGETWAWSREVPDYPADQGWALKYAFSNAASRFNITAAAAGSAFIVQVPFATTTTRTPGAYSWQAYVEKGSERYIIDRGTVQVQQGLVDESATPVDQRSTAQQALESARAALKQYTDTNGAVSEYEIAGRRVKYRSAQELVQLVNYWAGEVRKETLAERRRTGQRMAGRIFTRFGQ